MSIQISDSFAGSAAALVGRNAVTPAAPWVALAGSTSVLTVNGSGAASGSYSSGANSMAIAPGAPSTADYDVTTKIVLGTPVTGMAIGVAGRVNMSGGEANGYIARYNADGGLWELFCFQPGVAPVGIGSYAQALTAGVEYTLLLRMTGTTIKLFVNGVERISGTNASITAAGRTGLVWFSNGNTAITFTEFSVDAAGLLPPPVIQDYFAGAAGPLAGRAPDLPGGEWYAVSFAPETLQMDGYGRVKGSNTSAQNGLTVAPGELIDADYSVSARLLIGAPVSGMTAGVVGRLDTSAAALSGYVARYQADAGMWELYCFLLGVGTLIGTPYAQALTPGQQYLVTLTMTGSTIKLFVNGVERISGTNATITAPGRTGLYWYAGTNDNLAFTEFYVDGDGLELEAPVLKQTSGTDYEVTLDITHIFGGTPPYTVDLHRSATAAATAAPGNLIAAGASFPYIDGSPLDGKGYYRAVVTDSAAAEVESKEAVSERYGEPIEILFIGDSMTAQLGAATEAVSYLQRSGQPREVDAVVVGVNGSVSAGWVSGSTNLNNALAAAAAAGFSPGFIVSVCIGVNDCHQTSLVSAATFAANIASMVTAIAAAGGVAVLNMPICPNTGIYNGNLYTEDSIARLASYEPVLNARCRSSYARKGDRLAFGYFARNRSMLRDGLHPTDAGYLVLGRFWGEAIAAAVRPLSVISGGTLIGI